MTTFQGVFLANVLIGIALALIVWRSEVLRGHLLVHIAGVVCLVGGFKLMHMTLADEGLRAMGFFLLAGLAYLPFVIFLFFFWAGQILVALSGADEPVVFPKTYTAAEKAEAQGNFKRTIMLYRKELARDPKDLEARRRLAQVLMRDNQVEEAIGELRLAVIVSEDPDEEVELIMRVSDILLNTKLDFDTALADLDIVRKKYKGTPAGDRAQKRFQRVYILSQARKEREWEEAERPESSETSEEAGP